MLTGTSITADMCVFSNFLFPQIVSNGRSVCGQWRHLLPALAADSGGGI